MPIEESISVKFKGDVSDLETGVKRGSKSLEDFTAITDKVSKAAAAMVQNAAKAGGSIEANASSVQRLASAVNAYFKNVDIPTLSIDGLTKQIDTLQNKLKSSKATLSVTTDETGIKKITTEIGLLESELARLQGQSIVLKTTDVLDQFNQLNSSILSVESNIQKVESELKALRLNVDADPTQVNALKTELEGLKTNLTQLNNQKITLQAGEGFNVLSQLNNTIDTLQNKIASEKLRLSLETDPASINTIQKEITNLENNVKGLKGIAVEINTGAATKSISQLSNTIETLRGHLLFKKEQIITESDINKIAKYNKEIQELEQQIDRLQNIGKKGFNSLGDRVDKFGNVLNKLNKQNGAATQSLINLSRVAQDAPFGFIGIANNLNPLLESFQRLKAESGTAGNALKALGQSLIGPAGVGLALGIVSSLVIKFGGDIEKAFTSIDENAERFKTVFSGATGGFEKAASLVSELTINIDLAKKGLIDKEAVLKQYNGTIGITTGQVKNLDEAEQALVKNGSAYVRMMLFKAAANVALGEAAKKAFEISKEINKPTTTTQLISGSDRGRLEEEAKKLPEVKAAFDKAQKAFLDGNKDYKKFFDQRDALVEAFIEKNINKKLSNEQDEFLKIAENFQTKAAQISKDFKFTFFDDFSKGLKDAGNPKGEFNFFDKFFDFDFAGKLTAKQKSALQDAADSFSKEFGSVLQGLDFNTQPNAFEAAKQWWINFRKGIVKLKVPIPLDDASVQPPEFKEPTGLNGIDDFLKGLQQGFDKLNPNDVGSLPDALERQRIEILSRFEEMYREVGLKLPDVIKNELGKPIKVTGIGTVNLDAALAENLKKMLAFRDSIKSIFGSEFQNVFASIGTGIGDALAAGLDPLKAVTSSIAKFIGATISQIGDALIQYGVQKVILDKILKAGIALPGGIAIAAGIAAKAIGQLVQATRPKGFAEGGLVFGPTLGLVGEGRGTTRSNPEVVAPLNKLSQFLAGSGSQDTLLTRINGNDLEIILSRTGRRNGRVR